VKMMRMKKRKLLRRYVLVIFTLFNSFQCVVIGKQCNVVQPEAGKKSGRKCFKNTCF
jgi:hypothetical protein